MVGQLNRSVGSQGTGDLARATCGTGSMAPRALLGRAYWRAVGLAVSFSPSFSFAVFSRFSLLSSRTFVIVPSSSSGKKKSQRLLWPDKMDCGGHLAGCVLRNWVLSIHCHHHCYIEWIWMKSAASQEKLPCFSLILLHGSFKWHIFHTHNNNKKKKPLQWPCLSQSSRFIAINLRCHYVIGCLRWHYRSAITGYADGCLRNPFTQIPQEWQVRSWPGRADSYAWIMVAYPPSQSIADIFARRLGSLFTK